MIHAMNLAVLYIVLHQALYPATLSNEKGCISICRMTLHDLVGHLDKHKLVHRPADDLRMCMPV